MDNQQQHVLPKIQATEIEPQPTNNLLSPQQSAPTLAATSPTVSSSRSPPSSIELPNPALGGREDVAIGRQNPRGRNEGKERKDKRKRCNFFLRLFLSFADVARSNNHSRLIHLCTVSDQRRVALPFHKKSLGFSAQNQFLT